MLAGTGCEGQYHLPRLLLMGAEIYRTHMDCGQVWRGYRVPYQMATLPQTSLCWVINLAVSELSFKVSFTSSSPSFFFFFLTARSCKSKRKRVPSLLGFHPFTTHAITWSELYLMMSVLSGGGQKRPMGWLIFTYFSLEVELWWN